MAFLVLSKLMHQMCIEKFDRHHTTNLLNKYFKCALMVLFTNARCGSRWPLPCFSNTCEKPDTELALPITWDSTYLLNLAVTDARDLKSK